MKNCKEKSKKGSAEVNAADEKLRLSVLEAMELDDARLKEEMEKAGPHVFSEEFERKMEELMRVKEPETGEEMLKACIMEVMEKKEDELEEEMKNFEPHVFSKKFEEKMEAVMAVEKRKTRRYNAVRYVAAAIVTVLLVGGVIFIGNEEIRASKIGVEVLQWLENSFVVENKTDKDNAGDVLFEESRIGYLPEGFEKVEENVSFSKACYKYQNDAGEYIVLSVYRSKTVSGIDNEDIAQEVALNENGLEYRYVYREETEENIITWIDRDGKYYLLNSLMNKTELINIMNGISYLE